MTIPTPPPVLPMPIADQGDVHTIPVTTPAGSGQLSFESGFPRITQQPLAAGGIPPDRSDFNAVMRLLSQHTCFQQAGGVYPWVGDVSAGTGLNYLAGCHVMGSDGHEYIAKAPSGPDARDDNGTVGPKDPVADDGVYWLDLTRALQPKDGDRYELCEFYAFRHPTLKPGFQPAQGGLLVNAATVYPEAWAWLQTVEGQKLCKTEEEWQALTTATWATLADGSTVGWNGIGGAPFYAPDTATGALRLPDLRGMYAEAAGFDALGVGDTHGDGIRNIRGSFTCNDSPPSLGVFYRSATAVVANKASGNTSTDDRVAFDLSRVIPTTAKTQPRAWGALACVYLGQSAS